MLADSQSVGKQMSVVGLWAIRYHVKDVSRAVAFYTQRLGFKLDQQDPPAFGQVSLGDLRLMLTGPGASGFRPISDSGKQEPGVWNRVVLVWRPSQFFATAHLVEDNVSGSLPDERVRRIVPTGKPAIDCAFQFFH